MTMDDYYAFMFPIYACIITLLALYGTKVFMDLKYVDYIYEMPEKEKLLKAIISYVEMPVASILVLIYAYVRYFEIKDGLALYYIVMTIIDIWLIKVCISKIFPLKKRLDEIKYIESTKPRCRICEKILPDDAKICPNCGHDLNFKAKKGNKAYE